MERDGYMGEERGGHICCAEAHETPVDEVTFLS